MIDRLADEMERQEELRSRIVSASIYPLALVVLGGASVVVLLLLVVPRFGELLVDAGAELPAMTGALLTASAMLRSYWLYLLAGLAFVIIASSAYLATREGKEAIARLALGLPIVGKIRRGLLAARFSRLLGVLLEGGAPVVTALSDSEASLADPVAEGEVRRIREEVRVGTSLHRSVAAGRVFPPELARLVAVGEESGRLAEFLGRAADLFERRSVRAVERAVTLMEPVVIVVFGGLVAVVALALLQAIYGVNAGAFG
jgi:general secretion pathway protein F